MSIRAVVLLGAPGAGKGTMAEAVCAAGPWMHLSTGDMLRDAVRAGTEVGRAAARAMERGALVPDDVILGLVNDRLAAGPADAQYLFDGFPRTLEQARMLDAAFGRDGARLERVLLLEVPREVSEMRLSGRRVCGACGATYHLINLPPRAPGVCDRCGGRLEQRPDDSPETVGRRWDVFHRQTAGLIAYYEQRGVLARIDASGARDRTVAAVLDRLP